MTTPFKAAPAYARLHQHPLISAMIAVLSAAAIMLTVLCVCWATKSESPSSSATGGAGEAPVPAVESLL